jgi:hypothetical protein
MQMLMQAQLFSQRQTQIKTESDPRQIPINQGRSGHWDSKDGTEKMRRLGACDRLRAERFLPPGATDPDAVSGNMDPNPAESIAKNAQHHGAIPHLPRGKRRALAPRAVGGTVTPWRRSVTP